jgi:hypothetical protein
MMTLTEETKKSHLYSASIMEETEENPLMMKIFFQGSKDLSGL